MSLDQNFGPDRVARSFVGAAAASLRGRCPRMLRIAIFALLPFVLFGCSSLRKPISPKVTPSIGPFYSKGEASWYGPGFHGRRTANGERYDQYGYSAAHRTLPFGTRLTVTNLANGLSTVVKVNDRGPFARDRILDLSYGAAKAIGMLGTGTAVVQLELVGGPEPPPRYTVQVGAFSVPERANELQDRLRGTFPEVIVQTDGTWYRVQIGTFGERDQAEGMRRELAALGMSAFVIAAR